MYMIFAKGNDGKNSGRNNVDLYWSRFRRGGWTNPRLLNVNTSRSWDSTPYLSKDGKTLYFASNRSKGYGGTDIYSGTFYKCYDSGLYKMEGQGQHALAQGYNHSVGKYFAYVYTCVENTGTPLITNIQLN